MKFLISVFLVLMSMVSLAAHAGGPVLIKTLDFVGCGSGSSSMYRAYMSVSASNDMVVGVSTKNTNGSNIYTSSNINYTGAVPSFGLPGSNYSIRYLRLIDSSSNLFQTVTNYETTNDTMYASTATQNLEQFDDYAGNDNCSTTNPPSGSVPSAPVATAQIYDGCSNYAKVMFNVPGATSYEVYDSGYSTPTWTGTTTYAVRGWRTTRVSVKACNSSGCSAMSSSVTVGGRIPGQQCR